MIDLHEEFQRTNNSWRIINGLKPLPIMKREIKTACECNPHDNKVCDSCLKSEYAEEMYQDRMEGRRLRGIDDG